MLRFILDVLLLRQLIESRSVRRAVLFAFAVLFVVVLFSPSTFSSHSPKGLLVTMSSTTLATDIRLTPEQALLTDQIGNEVYASHYEQYGTG